MSPSNGVHIVDALLADPGPTTAACSTSCRQSRARRCRCTCRGQEHGTERPQGVRSERVPPGGDGGNVMKTTTATTPAWCDHCGCRREFEPHPTSPLTILCSVCGHLRTDRRAYRTPEVDR